MLQKILNLSYSFCFYKGDEVHSYSLRYLVDSTKVLLKLLDRIKGNLNSNYG